MHGVDFLHHEIEEYLTLKKDTTANIYRCGLRAFTNYYKKEYGNTATISDFLDKIFEEYKKPRREQRRLAEIEVANFIRYLKKRKLAPGTIRLQFASVQNFLKFKGVTITSSFIGNLPPNVSKKENRKHKWTIDHIREFIEKATCYRDKALIITMFQSGLAVQEIVNLDYGDIQKQFENGTLPICLHLVRQKTSTEFKTFLGRDAVHYLKLYLSTRNSLEYSSPLFTMLGSNRRISTSAIQQRFSEIAENLSFVSKTSLRTGFSPCRPHSLRSGFRSRLTGKISDDLIEFWLGHVLNGAKSAYINLPEQDLRELYLDAERFLCVEKTSRQELAERSSEQSTNLSETKIKTLEQTIFGLQHQLGVQEEIIKGFQKDYMTKLGDIEKLLWNQTHEEQLSEQKKHPMKLKKIYREPNPNFPKLSQKKIKIEQMKNKKKD